MTTPDFFIVGAPKCGTTTMYSYLRQHPEVFMPERKEPHHFGTDIRDSQFVRDRDDYLALFRDAGGATRVGEASTEYLRSHRAAREIHEFNPRARILAMLRNPVDMMHSLHSQRVWGGKEHITDFTEAMAAEAHRRERVAAGTAGPFTPRLLYREYARFPDQLERYLDAFGEDQVKVVLTDDLKADAAGAYSDVCRFLGVDPTHRPDFEVHNSNKVVRSHLLNRVLSRGSPVRRVGKALLEPLGVRGVLRAIRDLNTKHEPRPPMDPALRAQLTEEVRPHVERLEELLDRDLGHWLEVEEPAPPEGAHAPDTKGVGA